MTRPEHEKCVLFGSYVDGKPVRQTWCGRTPDAGEWTFVDAGHAALNGRAGGRLTVHSACAVEIAKSLGVAVDAAKKAGR